MKRNLAFGGLILAGFGLSQIALGCFYWGELGLGLLLAVVALGAFAWAATVVGALAVRVDHQHHHHWRAGCTGKNRVAAEELAVESVETSECGRAR